MSTTAAPRHKFLVYAPDMTDAEAFARRLSVRAKHLEKAGELTQQGLVSEYHSHDIHFHRSDYHR